MKLYRNKTLLKSIAFCLLLTACNSSTINLIKRDVTDLNINETNYQKIKGTYSNSCIEHSTWEITEMVFNKRELKKKYNHDSIILQINPINLKSIELKFLKNDSLLGTKVLKGEYKNGYFSAKTINRIEGLFPLFWGPSDQEMSFGITAQNNLVILESHGALAILVVAPLGGNNSQSAHEYKRIKE